MNDKSILAEGVVFEDNKGITRPNDNIVGVGVSGGGKSLSLGYPNMLHLENSSVIATFAKKAEALKMADYFKTKDYNVLICNLDNPYECGNVFFDPLQYIESFDDITDLSKKIVLSTMRNTKDDYWNFKAISLSDSLIEATIRMVDDSKMVDVLNAFDELTGSESGTGVKESLTDLFRSLREKDEHMGAVREFFSFYNLNRRTEKTGACIIDTLAAAYSTVFPNSIRKAMKDIETIDFKKMGTEKTALFIICSPVKISMHHFANIIYDTAIKVLVNYAQEFENGRLPINVKLFFDDFVATAPQAFPQYISVFRSSGISAILLIQSESMLESLYGKADATTILNNCSSYVYFPGGNDIETCRHVSEKMDIPMQEVLSAPIGNVFVMSSGRKPVIKPRYDIFNDLRYREMMGSGHKGCANK